MQPLGRLVYPHRAWPALAGAVFQVSRLDLQLSRVEHDFLDRLKHLESDGFLPVETRRLQVRGEANVVAGRDDGGR